MDNIKKIMETLKIKRILVIILIIVILLIIILPASVYYITIDDGTYKEDDWESTPFVASTYTSGVKVGENGITSDTSAQDLWDEMVKKNNNIKNYLDKPEELEKLMNAEIVTQYPKTGKDDAKLDGVIQFERHKEDGTSTFLTYVDYNTFSGYVQNNNTEAVNYFSLDGDGNAVVAIINTTTDIVTSNDEEFKVSEITDELTEDDKDSDGNYKKVTKIVSEQKINYKNFVQKYTMPFQYLWSLLVIGEDKDFVLELADLVENSEIVISIYDNITTNTNIDEYTYNKETRTDTYAEVSVSNTYGLKNIPTKGYWMPLKQIQELNAATKDIRRDADFSTDDTEYTITHKTIYETDTPMVDMTKADVWITNYSKEYTYQSAQTTSDESNSKDLDPTEYVKDENASGTSNGNSALLNNSHAQELAKKAKEYIEKNKPQDGQTSSKNVSLSDAKGNGASIKIQNNKFVVDSNSSTEAVIEDVVLPQYVECNVYKHRINRKQTTTNTISEQKYVAQTPTNNYKVEKGEGELNFVSILCDGYHGNAKYMLTSEITSWLFELLETNPDTINMVELTKFLFNKVTGTDKFGKFEDNFLDSLYGASSAANGSWSSIVTGDINVNDESNFIKDVETLKKAFSGYSNSSKLVEHAQEFLDMQNKYKVNALFAAAVSITETGAGTAGNAIKTATSSNSVGATIGTCWNNWFNIKAGKDSVYGLVYNGEGTSHYKIYSSVGASVDNFGSNIANGSYYFTQGKYTVSDIGHVYCPNSPAYPTQGDDWVKNTLSYINNFYNAAGITVSSLTSGSFVQYYQGDYASVPYGSSNLAKSGCGPTSFAMIASTLTGKTITPADAIAWCGNSYYISGSGTSWSYFAAAASHFGLGVTVNQTSSINDVITALKQGKYVISSQAPGLFTSGGHFIVLSGIDSSGNITVKDPNKNNAVTKGYNNRTFTSSEINQAAKGYWIFN